MVLVYIHNAITWIQMWQQCVVFLQQTVISKYRVAQNNVYTLWHEKYYSIIVTTVFIQKQNWYERCPWILDSV